jgi:aminoglycoside phosphotransferase (APT) family kinase protein
MESISKTRVEWPVAEAIVKDAFGKVELTHVEELRDGWFNAAYALELSDRRRVVLKVAPPPDVEVLTYERDILLAEVDALRRVRANTDAPVPEVLWFDDSLLHVGSPLFVMSFMPGVSLYGARGELEGESQAAIDRELGRYLRAINDIHSDQFGRVAPTATRHASWRDAFTELWSGLLADGQRKSVELPVSYGELEKAFETATPACDAVTEARLVYWDLWDGNVLIDVTAGIVTGMLDLERALWGDPLMEMQFGPHDERADVLTAYGPMERETSGARLRRAAYTLYLHLVMATEGVYRQYPDDFLGDWARGQLKADVEAVSVAG